MKIIVLEAHSITLHDLEHVLNILTLIFLTCLISLQQGFNDLMAWKVFNTVSHIELKKC